MEVVYKNTVFGAPEQYPFKTLAKATIFPLVFVILIWLVFGFEKFHEYNFVHFGIYPRTIDGVTGILTYPFIHSDINHIANNTVPLIILGTAIFYFYKPIAWKLILWTWLLSGFWTWVAARDAWHIGASMLIYGFAGFLFFSGIIRKNVKLTAISLLVVFLYGSMVWGIFPIDYTVSWEGHLFGSIAGAYLSVYFRKEGPQKEIYSWEEEDNNADINIVESGKDEVPGKSHSH